MESEVVVQVFAQRLSGQLPGSPYLDLRCHVGGGFKPRGRERSAGDKAANHSVNTLRAAVERAIAHLKDWKIFATRYRGPLARFPDIVKAVTALTFYKQAGETPVNRPPGLHQASKEIQRSCEMVSKPSVSGYSDCRCLRWASQIRHTSVSHPHRLTSTLREATLRQSSHTHAVILTC
ncbi:transposase family protein [Streptomyces sp. NPDC004787]|uniref:transposase family protein n=1 Tax=Streptomyces sp. NPDC004787 TaxID=3154291 RepID=UPI0033BBBA96